MHLVFFLFFFKNQHGDFKKQTNLESKSQISELGYSPLSFPGLSCFHDVVTSGKEGITGIYYMLLS